MANLAREARRALGWPLPLLLLAVILGIAPPTAQGGTFSSPYWAVTSSSPECVSAEFPAEAPSEWSPEGVSVRTGEFLRDFFLFDTPGMNERNVFSLRYRSMISGVTQFGRQVIPSWWTMIDVYNGDANVDVYLPTGQIIPFVLASGYYWTTACGFRSTVTKVSGVFYLTDKWGNQWAFDAQGMPDTYTDRNGNVWDFTFNSSRQWTGYTDDRGRSYTIHTAANGFIDYIEDPASRRWSFGYDAYDNLETITTPAITGFTSGITTTLLYDGGNRLTTITDGRGVDTDIAYVGSSGQVDTVTIDGSVVDYSYTTGRTDRTDREGYLCRYHHSGQAITQRDMWVSGAAKYVYQYRYSGSDLVTVVLPRGNRLDIDYDGSGNVTEKRRKTTDTNTNSGSDIVDSWGFTNNFVTSYTDSLGRQTTYGRDSNGNLTSITYPTVTSPATQTASKSFTVNAYGQTTEMTDEENKLVVFTYVGTAGATFGLLQKREIDPAGLDIETTYTYDAYGNVATVTDPNGNVTTTTWNALRWKTQVAAPSSLSLVKYTYDANGNVTLTEVENRDKDGVVVSGNRWIATAFTYTNTNQVATKTEEIDASTTRTFTFAYNDNDWLVLVTKPEGNKEAWTYNECGWIASHTLGATSLNPSTNVFLYDENGNVIEAEDGRNNATTYTYDLFDRRTRETNALGHYTEWVLDENGNATTIRRLDVSNNILQRRDQYFDERGRLWRTSDLRKDPSTTYSDAVTTREYFKTGHLKKVTNARGKDATFAYDNGWRQTLVTDAMGNAVSSGFDDNGNKTAWSIAEVDGASTVTHNYEATYDALNRRLTTREIDRTNSSNVLTTTNAYDSRSNLVWQVNAAGNPTRWTFDGLNRMIKREVAITVGSPIENFTSAQVTEWEFDRNDRLTAHKNDAARTTTMTYDALDRQVTTTYPDGLSVATSGYDANGNVTSFTDPAGNVVSDTFDAVNQNTARSVTRASGYVDTTSESRVFDALGRITRNDDNDYRVEYTYGVIGFESYVYEEKQSYMTGSAYLKTVTRTYDAVGNKATEANPSGLNLAYSYNDVDRLSAISDGSNTIAAYTYVGIRPKTTTFENGTTRTCAYPGFRGDVATVHHQRSTSTTILRLDYAYNAVHDRLYERYGAPGAVGDAFAYDNARKLSTAWMGSVNPTTPATSQYVGKIDYALDDDGNRASVVTTPWGGSPSNSSYSTNSLDQYTSVGGVTHTWDGNGNLTNDGTFKYEYNYKNLLVNVRNASTNALIATYKHDATGRRVEKAVVGGVFQRFVYSAHDIVATYGASDTWKQSIVYQQGVDAIVMLQLADVLDYDADSNTSEITRHYYHRNAAGSVMAVTDMNQNVAVSYRYDPYGVPTITRGGVVQSDDPLGQHWMHLGSFYDEEVGKYCYLGRTYDPARGRFQQRLDLGYLCGPNLYSAWDCSPTSPSVEVAGTKGTSIFARAALLYEGTWAGCAAPGRQGGVQFLVRPTLKDVLDEMDRLRAWYRDRKGPKTPEFPDGTPGLTPPYDDPMPPTGHPSGKSRVNCEVPATALYNDFKAKGWDPTYTVIRRYKKTTSGSPPKSSWTQTGWHCLVDLHTDDGKFRWFNGNKAGHPADGGTGESTEPDKNGDGTPTWTDGPGTTPTEENGDEAVRTEVYSSPEAANAAGAIPSDPAPPR